MNRSVLHIETKIHMLILSSIQSTEETGLLISIFVFLISTANRFSVKTFVV